ncbi:FHA domain-containing protein [Streptomyces sp. NPDC092296]|uniref:FHA domain-containing protein n=1 Tax=Streptomyces sp. NPDC092296 TaxID=3366012 RepID=UPI00381A89D9
MAPPSGAPGTYGARPAQGMAPPPFADPEATGGLANCPICRTPQTGRYCEECGYDYDLPGAHRPPAEAPRQQQGYGYPPQPPQQQSYNYPPQPSPDLFGNYPPNQDVPHQSSPQPAPSYGGYDTDFRLTPPVPQPPQSPEPPPSRATWVAVVSADREYFTQMMSRSGPEAQGLYFPPYCPERRIPMTGRGQLRIGRRSHHRGTVPEIDLSVPPEDPGASHQHALLQEQPDGNWIVVDQDSTNGTTVNGAPDTIAPHTAIPLKDGDRIHVGAWTTITIHCS